MKPLGPPFAVFDGAVCGVPQAINLSQRSHIMDSWLTRDCGLEVEGCLGRARWVSDEERPRGRELTEEESEPEAQGRRGWTEPEPEVAQSRREHGDPRRNEEKSASHRENVECFDKEALVMVRAALSLLPSATSDCWFSYNLLTLPCN